MLPHHSLQESDYFQPDLCPVCSSQAGFGLRAGPDGSRNHAAEKGAGIYSPAADVRPRVQRPAGG